MKIKITLLLVFLLNFLLKVSGQAPAITNPTNGQTGLQVKFTITATSSSTGNSSSSADAIYLELSKNISFSSSQGSPDYQRTTGSWNKTTNTLLTMNWAFTASLTNNTTYYVRAVSSKNGISAVISFTTISSSSVPEVITYPSNTQTGLPQKFTVTATSNSTGNSTSAKDNIYIELSKNISFSASQSSPDYQKSSTWIKSNDSPLAMNWSFSGVLDTSATYYLRVVSSKWGISSTISFTTGNTLIQQITYPTNGQTNLARSFTITGVSNSIGNSSGSPDIIYLEVSKNISFSAAQGSPDYQKSSGWTKTNDLTLNLNWTFSAALAGNATYYVRVTSSKNGNSPINTFTTIAMTAPALSLIDGASVATNAYANNSTAVLTSTSISGATSYNWEFDIEGDFAVPEYSTSSASTALNLDATTLLSGQAYWVRLQAISTTLPSFSNWSDATPVLFYNALHAATLWGPTGTSNVRSFKLWANNDITNATEFAFQIDDNKDFSSPYSNPNNFKNSTISNATGNVFLSNKDWYQSTGWTVSGNPILYKVFDYVASLQDQTKYYIRVMARNPNQPGYWGTIDSVFINLPSCSNYITNITDNQVNVSVNTTYIIYNDPNYDETSFDFQISEDNLFTSPTINIQNSPGFSKAVSLLKYNTTYYLRVRSYLNNSYPANPNAWSATKTFTTGDLVMALSSPTDGQVWTSLTTRAYAYIKPGITSYDWEIQKTSLPTSSSSKTTTTNYASFSPYIVAGESYQIRVRGNVASQPYTSGWSNWVSITTSAGATRQGSIDPSEDLESSAYPNPFSSSILIPVNPDLNDVIIEVNDQLGKKIEEVNLSHGDLLTMGERWSAGIYFIYIKSLNYTKVFRVVKK